ncbi:MAG: peptidoglycan-binding protein [Saprospiraceae bacterium]|nr:peptidoglycan-binding protein [Saprospiraceae bacterium]
MSEEKLFEQQKRDSLNYLNIFGLTVSSLKEKLEKLGYFNNEIDENFDKETVNALMKFQGDNEMRHIDGMFGELTFLMLGLKLEELKSKTANNA